MTRPSLLEAQYELHRTRPGFGTAQPGIAVYDLGTMQKTDPATRGLAIDTEAISDFMVTNGAEPEHVTYGTLGLFGPDSPWASIPGGSRAARRSGLVNKELTLTENSGGLRFPVIGLQYNHERIGEEKLNATLRHEIGHLLLADRIPLYNRSGLIAGLKMGAYLTSAATIPMLPDVFNQDRALYLHYVEGWTAASLFMGIGAVSMTAMAATLASVKLAYDAKDFLRRFDSGERKADAFADKHASFRPIKVLSTA